MLETTDPEPDGGILPRADTSGVPFAYRNFGALASDPAEDCAVCRPLVRFWAWTELLVDVPFA